MKIGAQKCSCTLFQISYLYLSAVRKFKRVLLPKVLICHDNKKYNAQSEQMIILSRL